jgi:pyruvate,water dikinase
MRFARTRIYGILRRMLRSIGRHLSDEGLLDDREDIFYLTLDEVFDFVKGTAVSTDLRGLARLRRQEYDEYRNDVAAAPDDRFETTGMAYHRNLFQQQHPPPQSGSNGSLSGIGCCPGVVSGRIQLVRDPANATGFDGDILVAERTDPGWVTLYPAFRGILIERGSPLSHSAIVAREMGIPTIVSVADLTKRLQTGDRVRMDGQAGVVQIIENDQPH